MALDSLVLFDIFSNSDIDKKCMEKGKNVCQFYSNKFCEINLHTSKDRLRRIKL